MDFGYGYLCANMCVAIGSHQCDPFAIGSNVLSAQNYGLKINRNMEIISFVSCSSILVLVAEIESFRLTFRLCFGSENYLFMKRNETKQKISFVRIRIAFGTETEEGKRCTFMDFADGMLRYDKKIYWIIYDSFKVFLNCNLYYSLSAENMTNCEFYVCFSPIKRTNE